MCRIRRRKGVLPPDWVMARMKWLYTPLINKAEIARRIGKAPAWVEVITQKPHKTSHITYNLIARLFKWPLWEWDDEDL